MALMTGELFREYGFVFAGIWMAHLAMGSSMSIIGPSLPYLGLNVGQSIFIVSFIYTAQAIGFIIVSIVTGFIFKRLKDGWRKMLWIAIGLLLSAIFILSVPFINNIYLLLAVIFIYGAGSAMADTANNTLSIFLLGPKRSRPFVQSIHFTVAVGSFIMPFIVRPFLIQIGESNSTQSICPTNDQNVSNNVITARTPATWEELVSSPLIWPYVIVSGITVIASLMFLIMAFKRQKLIEYGVEFKKEKTSIRHARSIRRNEGLGKIVKPILIIMFIIFYFLHSGMECVFWSHLYAFGACSDLKMSPGDASLLSLAFFGGFLAGRCSGVFIAKYLRPFVILMAASSGCIVTTGMLAIWGQTYVPVTMGASAVFGYFVSVFFASGISWLAKHIDVTGAISSTWFIGAFIGISVLPALAGLCFDTSVGAIGVMYLVCGVAVAVIIVFSGMNILLKYAGPKPDKEESQEIHVLN